MKEKRSKAKLIVTLVIVLLLSASTLFAERVVASQTLKIYARISARTYLDITPSGEIDFSSNSANANVSVIHQPGSTLLSVIAL